MEKKKNVADRPEVLKRYHVCLAGGGEQMLISACLHGGVALVMYGCRIKTFLASGV